MKERHCGRRRTQEAPMQEGRLGVRWPLWAVSTSMLSMAFAIMMTGRETAPLYGRDAVEPNGVRVDAVPASPGKAAAGSSKDTIGISASRDIPARSMRTAVAGSGIGKIAQVETDRSLVADTSPDQSIPGLGLPPGPGFAPSEW